MLHLQHLSSRVVSKCSARSFLHRRVVSAMVTRPMAPPSGGAPGCAATSTSPAASRRHLATRSLALIAAFGFVAPQCFAPFPQSAPRQLPFDRRADSAFAGASSDAAALGGQLGQAAPEPRVAMHVILPKRTATWKTNKPPVGKFRHTRRPDDREGWEEGVTVVDQLIFGKYGLQVLEEAWVSSKQLEDVRRELVTAMERKGKLWLRVFPHQVITKRNAESRVGAGKGNIEYWVAAVRKNFILFEFDDVTEEVLYNAVRRASYKLPFKLKLLKKESRPSEFDLRNMQGNYREAQR